MTGLLSVAVQTLRVGLGVGELQRISARDIFVVARPFTIEK
jgi:hypothetical protein